MAPTQLAKARAQTGQYLSQPENYQAPTFVTYVRAVVPMLGNGIAYTAHTKCLRQTPAIWAEDNRPRGPTAQAVTFSLLRIGALLLAVMVAACARGRGQAAATLTGVSRSPIPTAGLAVAPSPLIPETNQDLLTLAKQARVCGRNSFVSTAAAVNGRLYVGCRNVTTADGTGGTVLVVDADMHILYFLQTGMYSVESITAAGAHAIVASGYSDGAAMQSQLSVLDSSTLKAIVKHRMSDSTFLGVIGDRAYIDDWCCFGRPDTYAPATIYWISLRDASESERVDLAPDPQSHPGNLAQLGQGEHNYMRGHYYYVVVTDDNNNSITYRYDVLHLDRSPMRMRSSL